MTSCLKCRKTELVDAPADLTAEVKAESVLVTNFPALVCEECGYKTLRGSDMAEFMRRASDVYREKNGLLTSEEIRARRDRLDQSQQEFADHLGVGIASIKRWEMGQIQDRAMDKLIRVSTDPKEAHRNYQKVERLVCRSGKAESGTTKRSRRLAS